MSGAAAGTASGRCRQVDHAARTGIFLVAALLGSGAASGQSTWRIVPSIGVTETLTDNVALVPSNTKESDLITQVSPGINLTSQGRLKLNLTYRPTALLYANRSDANTIQNYLDAIGTYEAVPNWLYIDASANIGQQSFSAFAPQANIATENINANRAETFSYRFSPYIRGRLGVNADYQLRYSYAASQVRGSDLGQTQVQDWLGTITSRPAPTGLAWALTASYQTANTGLFSGSSQAIQPVGSVAADSWAERLYATVNYSFDPELRVGILGGWESNNYAGTTTSSATYGGQFERAPTVRTQLHARYEHRPSTNTYEFSFSHRTRLTAWRLTDSKIITTLPTQLLLGRTQSAFDLLFTALTTSFPDPIARTDEVNRILQQNGIPRDLTVAPLFLSSRVFIQHSQNISFVLLGSRNTVTVVGTIAKSRSTDSGVPVSDTSSLASETEQRTVSASWSHRLSAITSLNLLGTYTRGIGSGLNSTDSSDQLTTSLLLTHQISRRTYGTLGARYINFSASTSTAANDVREKAILGSIVVTFY
jgi:uncharacterized protein (PEP-CTERM system associated)